MKRRVFLALAFVLASASVAAAQVVAQGAPAPTTDARAWPFKVVVGNAQIDPRDVSDRSGRLLGQVTFGSPQAVTQSGSWTFSFTTQGNLDIALSALRDALRGASNRTLTDLYNQFANVAFAAPQHVIVDSSAELTVSVPAGVGVFGTDGDSQHQLATTIAGVLKVDGSAVTQPVSGTVTANAGTGTFAVSGPLTDVQLRASAVPISAAALPLPSTAATSTKQSDGSQKTQIVDGSGNVIGATSNAIDVNIKSGNPTTITATQATGSNLHVVVDTAPTTAVTNAGLSNLDVALSTRLKPADTLTKVSTVDTITNPVTVTDGVGPLNVIVDSGSTVVTQGTAASLNATVVGTGTFATQVASATAPVSTMNSSSANAGVNVANAAVFDDTSPTAITENSFGFLRMSANRNAYATIRDAAGNERGLNVDANGELGVSAIRSALPAGTNAIGKLAANSGVDIGDVDVTSIAAGNNNIGDVDVASLPALVAGTALIGKVGIDQTTPGTTNRVDIGVFPDNEPVDVARMNGVAVTMGNGASGTGVQRVTLADDSTGKVRIWDGTDVALVSASGEVSVNCTTGCAAAATSNIVAINSNESVAAPTAAVWYIKRQWALPASAHAQPKRAWASVTTAGSRTMIGIINNLGNLNTGTNTFTAGNSVASPFFYGRLLGCVTTVLSAASDNITPTYTDELGNSQATAAVTFAASAPVGNCYEFPLAAASGPIGDTGVRAVTAATDSAATTGVVTFYGFNPILDSLGPASVTDSTIYDDGELSANEQVVILLMQAATTAQQRGAGVTLSLR